MLARRYPTIALRFTKYLGHTFSPIQIRLRHQIRQSKVPSSQKVQVRVRFPLCGGEGGCTAISTTDLDLVAFKISPLSHNDEQCSSHVPDDLNDETGITQPGKDSHLLKESWYKQQSLAQSRFEILVWKQIKVLHLWGGRVSLFKSREQNNFFFTVICGPDTTFWKLTPFPFSLATSGMQATDPVFEPCTFLNPLVALLHLHPKTQQFCYLILISCMCLQFCSSL